MSLPWLPPDGSAHGAEIDRLLAILHLFMAIVFAVWFIYFVAMLVRYRSSGGATGPRPAPRGRLLAGTVVTVLVVEIVLDVFFSIPIWSKRSQELPDPGSSTVVRIVAEQYAWNVHYPGPDGTFGRADAGLVDPFNPLGLDRDDPAAKDDVTLLNQLTVPAGTPVLIYLTSKDVIHSLNLPVFRIKQDAVPGLMSPVWFLPEKTTARIRDEMATSFSVEAAVATETLLRLPGDGSFDQYIAVGPCVGPSGDTILAAHETPGEDAVTALVAAGITGIRARRKSHTDPWVVHGTPAPGDGSPIAAAGSPLDEEVISKAAAAGLRSLPVAPLTPTEIACAQLCGLGHYQMRAAVEVVEPAEYRAWMEEQQAALGNVPDPDTTSNEGASR